MLVPLDIGPIAGFQIPFPNSARVKREKPRGQGKSDLVLDILWAEAEFRSTKVVSVKTFADISALKGLKPKYTFLAQDSAEAPPIDQYDLMVVDECPTVKRPTRS